MMKRNQLAHSILAALGALTATAAHAATISVTTNDEGSGGTGDCTLREAINAANANMAVNGCAAGDDATPIDSDLDGVDDISGDRIDLSAISGQTISLASSLPSITQNTEISGSDITVDGGGNVQPFYLASYALRMDSLTIQNGSAVRGGGIFAHQDTTLAIVESTFYANAVSDRGGAVLASTDANAFIKSTLFSENSAQQGGGVWLEDGTVGRILDSTFSGNEATQLGGGLGTNYEGSLTITNTSFSRNTAGNLGGGIFIGGSSYANDAGPVSLSHLTISGNVSGSDGSGIYLNDNATVTIQNSIIANSDGADCAEDSAANVSIANTLVEDGSCSITDGVNGNQISDPQLGLLRDNGGPTPTMQPNATSPAVDAAPTDGDGSCAGVTTDQRGEMRPAAFDESGGGSCDLGAVELNESQDPASIEINTLATDNDGLCGDLADGFDCSIREAINLANSAPSTPSTITFADAVTLGVTAGDSVTMQFTEDADGANALPSIVGTVDIAGPADFSLTLDPTTTCNRRLVSIESDANLILSDFSVAGSCKASAIQINDNGGAIRVEDDGSLSVNRMTFRDNYSKGVGGALFASFNCDVSVNDSTFSGNTSNIQGGAIVINSYGTLHLSNSTLSGNSSSTFAGAVYVSDDSSATITNTTIFGNSAASSTSGFFAAYDATVVITNSVLSGANRADCRLNAGSVATITNTLIDDGSCGVVNGVDGNLTGDPLLGVLQDNGGPTETNLPLDGSPVIDAVAAVAGLCAGASTDQRGATRPDDGDGTGGFACDMGAVEVSGDVQVGADFVVNATNDADDGICGTGIGECTLREALESANADANASTISFDGSVFGAAQTITLSMGQLAITAATTVTGPGASLLTINANRASRHFVINDGNDAEDSVVSISGLTLMNGESSDDGGSINAREPLTLSDMVLTGNTASDYAYGGALHTVASLQMESCTLSNNRGDYYAAGIQADLSATETVTVTNSVFSGNNSRGYYGAALYLTGGTLSVVESTFSQNQALYGGAIRINGATDATIERSTFADNLGRSGGAVAVFIDAANTVSLRNSTFQGNYSVRDGGAIFHSEGSLELRHTTLASNSSGIGSSTLIVRDDNAASIDVHASIFVGGGSLCSLGASAVQSGANNLATDASCAGIGAANVSFGDINLGSLADNGGSTQTVLPGPGSVAVDAVASAAGQCEGLDTDQRGIPRPLNAGGGADCDIGAVEVMNDPVAAMSNRFSVSEDAATLNNTDIDGTTTPADSSDDGVLVGEDSTDDEDEGISVSDFGGTAAGNKLTLASGAMLTIEADGSFTFNGTGFYESLGAGETDTEAVDYTATDGYSSDTASLIIDITGANDNPVAEDVNTSADEDEQVTAAYAATDIDATDTLSFALSGFSPLFTDNTDGTFTFDANQPPFQSLNVGDTDSALIGFTVTDGSGAMDTGTITVTVNGQNDSPIALPVPELAAAEDATTSGNFNATDVDNDTADLTFDVTGQPSAGTVTPATGDAFDFNPGGQFETLAGGESSTVGFTFRVTDPGGLSSTSTGTIRVDGANDAPVANDDGYITDQNTPLNVAAAIGLLANDSDIDTSNALTVVDASVMPVSGPGGSLIAASDGSFTYTPPVDSSGLEVFTYQITDGMEQSTATITIRVGLDNQPPSAADDAYMVDENTTLTVDAPGVLDNDSDPESNPLSVNSAGTFVAQGIGGMVMLNADGSFDYTPPSNASGEAGFLYTITDGFGNQDSATITITVSNIDDAPNAVDDMLAPVLEDSGVQTIPASALLGNDDAGAGDTTDSIRITSVSAVAGVLASLDDGGTTDPTDDVVQVTPLADFFGEASFTYTIEDDAGTPATATARLPVTPVNDPPQFSLLGDQSFTAGTTGVQVIDGFVNVTSLGPNEMNQIVQRIDVATISDSSGVVDLVSIDDTGRLSLVLSGANGIATFDVTVTDNGGTTAGGNDTAPAQTFTVSVGQELETLFSDGFEAPVINKSFNARSTTLSKAALGARTRGTMPALVLRARSIGSSSYLEVYAREKADRVQLQMVRFENGELARGAWRDVQDTAINLQW